MDPVRLSYYEVSQERKRQILQAILLYESKKESILKTNLFTKLRKKTNLQLMKGKRWGRDKLEFWIKESHYSTKNEQTIGPHYSIRKLLPIFCNNL